MKARPPLARVEDSRANHVAADHALHWMALLAATGYAWRLHGFWVGVAILLGLIGLIGGSNTIILIKSGSFAIVRANRWLWVLLAFALLAWSGAEAGRV